jgi:hypothetical protein
VSGISERRVVGSFEPTKPSRKPATIVHEESKKRSRNVGGDVRHEARNQ